jgi:hypothetical protein
MARSVSVARRFSLAYVSLAALFGAGIGTFLVLLERPGPKPPPPWSVWQPTETERGLRQKQIATHVGSQYHLAGGKKLVSVLVRDTGANRVQDVAVAHTLEPTKRSDFIAYVNPKKTVIYILCGDAQQPKCSINGGQPSTARTALLRREALELALYTFRYLDGTDSVIAFLPPKDLANALYFAKSDLKDELHAPLRRTLPQAKAPLAGSVSRAERRIVDALTVPRQFRFQFQQERDGASALVLVPAS